MMAVRRRKGFGAERPALPKRTLDVEFILPTYWFLDSPYRDEPCPRCGRALRLIETGGRTLALDIETKRPLKTGPLVLEHTAALCATFL